MLLSEWRKAAPNRDSMGGGVLAVLHPVLADLGADADPECWVSWGDDPEVRYSVLAPTVGGLIAVVVRVNTPGEGPRATAKLIRWSKLQISELSVEAVGGHRMVAVQLEGQFIKGMDEEADQICEFVRGLIATVDGRTAAPIQPVGALPVSGATQAARSTKTAAPKTAAQKGLLRLPEPKTAPTAPTAPTPPMAAKPKTAERAAPRNARPAAQKTPKLVAEARLEPEAKPVPVPAAAPAAAPKPVHKPKAAEPEAPIPAAATWVAPHPIPLSAKPAPAIRAPAAPLPAVPAAARGPRPAGEWAEIDKLHGQPADRSLVAKPAKESKPARPRPWRP